MDCRNTIKHLDDFFDGNLEAGLQEDVARHTSECRQCADLYKEEKAFRQALGNMPPPLPSPEFKAIVFRNVAALQQKKSRRRTWLSMGTALAAGLMLWLSTTVTGPIMQTPGNTADMTLAVNETQNIEILFESPRMLQNASLTLTIPEELDLVDYPGTRELSWTANIKQGQNMLTLPVRAMEAGDIFLVTRVEHDNHSKTQTFHLAVQATPLIEGRLDLLQTV